MTLVDRAASALDMTHNPSLSLANDPYTIRVRNYLAAWLDGHRTKQTFIIAGCKYLEMAAA